MSENQAHLLVLSVGPVQEFIASARRTRDLWFGSYLLSEAAKAAAKAITDFPGESLESLIFPATSDAFDLEPNQTRGVSVPNVVLAKVNSAPDKIAEAAANAAEGVVTGYAEAAFTRVMQPEDDPTVKVSEIHVEQARRQVADLLEFYWAAVPLAADESDYAEKRQRVYDLLNARKNTREFIQVRPFDPDSPDPGSWGGPLPKSSLDGLRESVLDEGVLERRRNQDGTFESTAEHALRLYRAYRVQPGERLCGVGILKRHGHLAGQNTVYSTSHMAALPWLEGLKTRLPALEDEAQDQIKRAFDSYIGLVEARVTALLDRITNDHKDIEAVVRSYLNCLPSEVELHPVLSFPDGNYDGRLLFTERLREYFDGKDLTDAQTALAKFLKAATGGVAPHPYYALFHADGDHMGKALERITSSAEHRAFSGELLKFVHFARRTVTEAKGILVYAGGDDVLALLPLHTALGCAYRLALGFAHQLSRYGGLEGFPGLSGGMVIAHHLEPLQDVLGWAREAEAAAKGRYGRGALAVTLAKRGGDNATVGGKWGVLVDRLNFLTRLHLEDRVPDGAAHELLEAVRPLDARMTQGEAVRILGRKRARRGAGLLEAEVLEGLSRITREAGPETLARELLVAAEFAKAVRLSRGVSPAGPLEVTP